MTRSVVRSGRRSSGCWRRGMRAWCWTCTGDGRPIPPCCLSTRTISASLVRNVQGTCEARYGSARAAQIWFLGAGWPSHAKDQDSGRALREREQPREPPLFAVFRLPALDMSIPRGMQDDAPGYVDRMLYARFRARTGSVVANDEISGTRKQ